MRYETDTAVLVCLDCRNTQSAGDTRDGETCNKCGSNELRSAEYTDL